MKPAKPIAWRIRAQRRQTLSENFQRWLAAKVFVNEPLVLLSKESKPIDPNDPGLLALLQRPSGAQSHPLASGSV